MRIGPYETGRVYQGDCLELMKAISPVSVPLEDCWRPRKLPFTDPLPKALPAELL